MPYVDDSIDVMLEEVLRGATQEQLPTPASPSAPQSRLARFFGSLAASMALQHRSTRQPSYRREPIQSPTDMLAQNYPHLYFHVMCG